MLLLEDHRPLYLKTRDKIELLVGDIEEAFSRGYWPTPFEATKALMPHLPARFRYAEPCAGDARLTHHIKRHKPQAFVTRLIDICPQAPDIFQADALYATLGDLTSSIYGEPDFIITNPPWKPYLMERLILHFASIKPTWCLLNATWLHTKRAARIMHHCHKVVSVGRVQWVPGSVGTGKIDAVWCLFGEEHNRQPKFYPNGVKAKAPASVQIAGAPPVRKRLVNGAWITEGMLL